MDHIFLIFLLRLKMSSMNLYRFLSNVATQYGHANHVIKESFISTTHLKILYLVYKIHCHLSRTMLAIRHYGAGHYLTVRMIKDYETNLIKT